MVGWAPRLPELASLAVTGLQVRLRYESAAAVAEIVAVIENVFQRSRWTIISIVPNKLPMVPGDCTLKNSFSRFHLHW